MASSPLVHWVCLAWHPSRRCVGLFCERGLRKVDMASGSPVGEPPGHDVFNTLRATLAAGQVPDGLLARDVDLLFAEQQARVQRLCRQLLRDPETASEVAQETMLVAYRRLPSFEQRSSFGTWVYGIARNLCRNRRRLRRELLSDDGVVDPPDPGQSVLTRLPGQSRTSWRTRLSAPCHETSDRCSTCATSTPCRARASRASWACSGARHGSCCSAPADTSSASCGAAWT